MPKTIYQKLAKEFLEIDKLMNSDDLTQRKNGKHRFENFAQRLCQWEINPEYVDKELELMGHEVAIGT
jgi:hypothetical protein